MIYNDILDVLDEIKTLASKSGNDAGQELRLLDLNKSLENIDPTYTSAEVKSSGGMSKLKKFIYEASEVGSDTNKFIESISGGLEKLQIIGCKYNSVAEWCGAPQIPNIFLDSKP